MKIYLWFRRTSSTAGRHMHVFENSTQRYTKSAYIQSFEIDIANVCLMPKLSNGKLLYS